MPAELFLPLATCRTQPVSRIGVLARELANWASKLPEMAPTWVLPLSAWQETLAHSHLEQAFEHWWSIASASDHDALTLEAELSQLLDQLKLPPTLQQQLIANYNSLMHDQPVWVRSSSTLGANLTNQRYVAGDTNFLEAIVKTWRDHCLAVCQRQPLPRNLKWSEMGGGVVVTLHPAAVASGELTTIHQFTHSKVITIRGQWGCFAPSLGIMPSDEFRFDPRTQSITFRNIANKVQQLTWKMGELVPQGTKKELAASACLSDAAVIKLANLGWQAKQHSFNHLQLRWLAIPDPTQRQQLTFLIQDVQALEPGQHEQAVVSSAMVRGRSLQGGYIQQRCWVEPASAKHLAQIQRSQPFVPGSILVVTQLESRHLPLLRQASGVVIEQPISNHQGLVMIKEAHLPSIDKATRATQILRTGQEVVLHAGGGQVLPLMSAKITAPTTPAATTATQLLLEVTGANLVPTEAPAQQGIVWDSNYIWKKIGVHPLALVRTKQQAMVSSLIRQDLERWQSAVGTNQPWLYRLTDGSLHLWQHLQQGERWSDDQTALNSHHQGLELYLAQPEFLAFELQVVQQLAKFHPQLNQLVIPGVRTLATTQQFLGLAKQIGPSEISQTKWWLEMGSAAAILELAELQLLPVAGIIIDIATIARGLLGWPSTGEPRASWQIQEWQEGLRLAALLLKSNLKPMAGSLHLPILVRTPEVPRPIVELLLSAQIQGLITTPEFSLAAKPVIMEIEHQLVNAAAQ